MLEKDFMASDVGKSLPLPDYHFGVKPVKVDKGLLFFSGLVWLVFLVGFIFLSVGQAFGLSWVFVTLAIVFSLGFVGFVIVVFENCQNRYELARREGRDAYVLKDFGPWFEEKYKLSMNQWEIRKLYSGVRVEAMDANGHIVSVVAKDFEFVKAVSNGLDLLELEKDEPWLQHFVSKEEYQKLGSSPKE